MKFFVKLRDLAPGDVSVKRDLEPSEINGSPELAWWRLLQRSLKLPPEVWGVTVDVRISVDQIAADDEPKDDAQ
jgi:hypothetical protein